MDQLKILISWHGRTKASAPALSQLHFHSRPITWLQWIGQRQLKDKTRNLYVFEFGASYIWSLVWRYSLCRTYGVISANIITKYEPVIHRMWDKMTAIFLIFQMHFLEWRFIWISIKILQVCSQGSYWQYASIGLVPNSRQTIIWTDGDLGYRRIYASQWVNIMNAQHFSS